MEKKKKVALFSDFPQQISRYCVFPSVGQRSGFSTRMDKDATFSDDVLVQDSYVSVARRNIARSRKLPDIAEVHVGTEHHPVVIKVRKRLRF